MKIHFYKARAGKIGDKIVGIVSIFSHRKIKQHFYLVPNMIYTLITNIISVKLTILRHTM